MTGQKYGLPLLSPVDDDGNFTSEAGQFEGLNVLGDGNTAVVTALDSHSALLMEEAYGDYQHFTPSSSCVSPSSPVFEHCSIFLFICFMAPSH